MSIELVITIITAIILPGVFAIWKASTFMNSLENTIHTLSVSVNDLRNIVANMEHKVKTDIKEEIANLDKKLTEKIDIKIEHYGLEHQKQHSEEAMNTMAKFTEEKLASMDYVDEFVKNKKTR